jgi:Ran GTPase-activating protein (RanGAP) involved in mRNA processing and transport
MAPVEVQFNLFDADVVSELAPVWGSMPELTALDLSNNPIGDAGCLALSGHLPPKLASLCLSSCGLSGSSAIVLADALHHAPLESLDLRGNSIRLRGARALAVHLPATLTTLLLAGNGIGSDGCLALAGALPRWRLRRLGLQENAINDEAAAALFAALPHSAPHLQVLLLSSNDLALRSSTAFADVLGALPDLEICGLAGNSMGPDCFAVLENALVDHVRADIELGVPVNLDRVLATIHARRRFNPP